MCFLPLTSSHARDSYVMTEVTGTVDFRVGKETYKTWYKVIGDLTSGLRPLVTLHGGPGMSHVYMQSHAEIFTTYNIPVVFYDQLGTGKSTHITDKGADFWTPELFIDELNNLLACLGIKDDFDLLGHSWGGMLAADYASAQRRPGLRRLIIANAAPSLKLWEQSMHHWLNKFPEDFREMLRRHERDGTTSSEEYQRGMKEFYNKHTCQVIPWPVELDQSFADMDENPTVYTTMFGSSEFNLTGSLITWDVTDRLDKISCPTLVCNGHEEGAQDFVVEPFIEKIPKIKWVKFKKTHIPFYEDKEYYFETIGAFLIPT